MSVVIGIVALCMAIVLGVTLGIWLLPLLIGLFAVAFVVLCFVFWIWMLVDCIQNQNIGGSEKVTWAVVIALTHFLGALIYFFAARTRRPSANMRPMA